eukprot:COSAG02_NODE_124_length_35047_cov_31.554179_32_plen_73_part_00
MRSSAPSCLVLALACPSPATMLSISHRGVASRGHVPFAAATGSASIHMRARAHALGTAVLALWSSHKLELVR